MPGPSVLLSLITRDNDYQREQASVAEETARRLGIALSIEYAEGEAITQTRQLLNAVQAPPEQRPSAMIVEPVGTGMLSVAAAAVRHGVGWIVLNRESDYLAQLRAGATIPIGSVECDNVEIGRIQGRQFAALLPQGGTALYVEGPGEAAKLRRTGLNESKPANITLVTVRGRWTEESGKQAITPRLPQQPGESPAFALIGCQNDAMAMGARRAVEALPDPVQRAACLRIPLTGVDGVPGCGQAWVAQRLLAATIITPPLTGLALELLAEALATGRQVPERTLTRPASFPTLPELGAEGS